MIEFSQKIIRSFVDLPNKLSAIFHATGCNLRCFGCFNYDSIVLRNTPLTNDKWILEQIRNNGYMFDAVIFSGGEFLNNSEKDIVSFLSQVRKEYRGIIIINTNGTHPEKMETAIRNNLCDGFHVDCKIPLNLFTPFYSNIVSTTLGVDDVELKDKIINSLHIAVRTDKGYSQIRTIRYPFFSDKILEQNGEYIKKINDEYGKATPYFINEFYEMGGGDS